MPVDPAQTLVYRRARFATRLPLDRRYTASHYWLLEVAPSRWRVGFTKFATRMLGDLVEYNLAIAEGDRLTVGQTIGSVEGFKAIADLFCVASGVFLRGNSDLDSDPTLVDTDPYDRGWLYEVSGEPDPAAVDAGGYAAILDSIIDKILQSAALGEGGESCPMPGRPPSSRGRAP